jgi:L-methionine (R)-S-oxide reductase
MAQLNAEFDPAMQSWLVRFLSQAGATAGTVHLYKEGGLRRTAAVNIPPQVQQAVQWVPVGKGMAGLALERGEPVQTCNLQDDGPSAVQPGARAVNAKAAVALPVRDQAGAILAVVGAAFSEEREIHGAELERLQRAAAALAGVVG